LAILSTPSPRFFLNAVANPEAITTTRHGGRPGWRHVFNNPAMTEGVVAVGPWIGLVLVGMALLAVHGLVEKLALPTDGLWQWLSHVPSSS
jgi:hypothetical protein